MANSDSKVWLITGSSGRFGRSLTEAVLKNGDRVVVTARKLEQLDDLVKQYPDRIKTVCLDVRFTGLPNEKLQIAPPDRTVKFNLFPLWRLRSKSS